jgi:hypothetical protein
MKGKRNLNRGKMNEVFICRICLSPVWKGEVLGSSPVTHFLLFATPRDVTSPLIDRLPAVRICDPALDWHSETHRHKDLRRRQISKIKIKKIRAQRSLRCYRSLQVYCLFMSTDVRILKSSLLFYVLSSVAEFTPPFHPSLVTSMDR